MRTAFVNSLTELMRKDANLITVTADMGFSVFEDVRSEFGPRFINTGVTEQASISVACGLALSGHKVFFYAQSAFATMRCFEQVRLDIGYNNLDVKIVGAAAGLSLNQLGVSHFATEDIALMRLIPTFTVFSPGDPVEATWAIHEAYTLKTPAYIRISKTGSDVFHKRPLKLKIGKGISLVHGKDVALFVCGGLLSLAFEVRVYLKKRGINAAVISMPTIKPLDKNLVLAEAQKKKAVITLEEHFVTGGLGSAVAEVLSENNVRTAFVRFGIPDKFISITGSVPYLLSQCGLTKEKIGQKIFAELRR